MFYWLLMFSVAFITILASGKNNYYSFYSQCYNRKNNIKNKQNPIFLPKMERHYGDCNIYTIMI